MTDPTAESAERDRIAGRLSRVRLTTDTGVLIAGPELGPAWIQALAEEVEVLVAEQVAARVAEAGPDAIRDAADNLYLTGPGQHNELTASWLHRRANLLDPRTRQDALVAEAALFPDRDTTPPAAVGEPDVVSCPWCDTKPPRPGTPDPTGPCICETFCGRDR